MDACKQTERSPNTLISKNWDIVTNPKINNKDRAFSSVYYFWQKVGEGNPTGRKNKGDEVKIVIGTYYEQGKTFELSSGVSVTIAKFVEWNIATFSSSKTSTTGAYSEQEYLHKVTEDGYDYMPTVMLEAVHVGRWFREVGSWSLYDTTSAGFTGKATVVWCKKKCSC